MQQTHTGFSVLSDVLTPHCAYLKPNIQAPDDPDALETETMEQRSADYPTLKDLHNIEQRAHELRAEAVRDGFVALKGYIAGIFKGVSFRSTSHADA